MTKLSWILRCLLELDIAGLTMCTRTVARVLSERLDGFVTVSSYLRKSLHRHSMAALPAGRALVEIHTAETRKSSNLRSWRYLAYPIASRLLTNPKPTQAILGQSHAPTELDARFISLAASFPGRAVGYLIEI